MRFRTPKRLILTVEIFVFILGSAQAAERDMTSGDKQPVPPSELWLNYSGDEGPGQGKHVVPPTARGVFLEGRPL